MKAFIIVSLSAITVAVLVCSFTYLHDRAETRRAVERRAEQLKAEFAARNAASAAMLKETEQMLTNWDAEEREQQRQHDIDANQHHHSTR